VLLGREQVNLKLMFFSCKRQTTDLNLKIITIRTDIYIKFPQFPRLVPNVVAEWSTLLLRIREIPGSNLGPQTGYPK
jgi:hypothetical protein